MPANMPMERTGSAGRSIGSPSDGQAIPRYRRPLEEPIALGATWELRCGPRNRFRVFYEVDVSQNAVRILGIGVKEGSRLFVGGEEIEP